MTDDKRREGEPGAPAPRPFGSDPHPPEPPRPSVDAAFASLERGLGSLFKAAETAVGSIKRELDKTQVTRDLNRAIEDAGREVVRATTNVASFVGQELTDWSKKVEATVGAPTAAGEASAADAPRADAATGVDAPSGAPTGPSEAAGVPRGDEWPKSREDYERRYGPVEGDWPRSAEEYERRFGRKPKQSGPTDDDPGFTILGG